MPAMAAACVGEQSRARIDTQVAGAGLGNYWGQHSWPCTNIQDLFTACGCEQVKHRWNGQVAVVLTALLANPAGIPIGNWIPPCALVKPATFALIHAGRSSLCRVARSAYRAIVRWESWSSVTCYSRTVAGRNR